MKDKYLKPFSVEMYNEIESNPDFKIVNGKNEEVIIVDTNVSIHGEPGHILSWIVTANTPKVQPHATCTSEPLPLTSQLLTKT